MTEHVTMALSELRSLITKAARGAGLDWGMAEEAGWAAEWLARRGLPAADWATLWLAARIEGAQSPVEVGAQLADTRAAGPAPDCSALPDGLVAPGYLLPFLHRLALGQTAVAIGSARGQVALVAPDGQVIFGSGWQPQSEGWTLSPAAAAPAAPCHVTRPVVSKAVLDCLEGLALWTTVPQSATSRLDAGSSTGDND